MAFLCHRLALYIGILTLCFISIIRCEEKASNEVLSAENEISPPEKEHEITAKRLDQPQDNTAAVDLGNDASNDLVDFDLGHTLEGNRDRSRTRSRQRFLQNHRTVAPSQPVQTGITPRMARVIVGMHNTFRRTVPGPAANMEEMKWDDDLTRMASEYSKGCIWAHGNPENITPYQHVGQNLAYGRGGGATSPLYLISFWFNERKNYDIYTDSCVPGTVCGHYTQVVWAHTNKIGCAMNFCPVLTDPEPDGGEFKDAYFLVCNYGPGGNLKHHLPYSIGEPCSSCVSGLGNCIHGLCSDCSLIEPGCECHLECQNGGSIKPDQCKCDCTPGWTGTLCQNVCNNTHPWCGEGWPKHWCFVEDDDNPVEQLCPALCGVCECGGEECLNGGIKNPDTCMCDCVEPWSGPTCSECNIECVHGYMDHDSCHCSCDDGWMGQSCFQRCENTNKDLCHRGWYPNWCDEDHPYVLKYCQAMCGLCNPLMSPFSNGDCRLTCYNRGRLNSKTCTCECPNGWHGEDCTAMCQDEFEYCQWSDATMCENNEDFAYNFCPVSCGKCTP